MKRLTDTPNGELAASLLMEKSTGPGSVESAPASLKTVTTVTEEIVEALGQVELLRGLSNDEFRWLAERGTERASEGRTVVFAENEPAHHMMIILRGDIYVHRRNAGSVLFTAGRTAQITGKLPYSRMRQWRAEGCSSDALWLLEIHESLFPELLDAVPSMAQRCVSLLLERTRDFATADLQAEKLISLGKLAANLSHELKNPASVIRGAAQGLGAATDRVEELCALGRLFSTDAELERYYKWNAFLRGASANATLPDIDREEQIAEWLERHLISHAWEIAPELARTHMQREDLERMRADFTEATFPQVLLSLSRSVRALNLTAALTESAQRIFHIIQAVQDYAYMDQEPIQEIDLTASLQNALALLQSDLRAVTISLDFDPSTPRVTGYGAELSQVWTALLENAIYATHGRGSITITTKPKGDMAFVEICDDGSGIPANVLSRIFEPFFTTKPLGQGLGLGLDTVRRIIEKHFGSVSVSSKPGSTCFQVRLPINRVQIY
jgi:signal transduction histidine kinase